MVTKAALKKELKALGIKTYKNTKQESFVRKGDVKKMLANIVESVFHKELQTSEPIKIIVEDSAWGNEVLVKVDGIDYAIIRHADMEELDEAKIVEWVEETYYEGDYKSSAYTPPSFDAKEFK